MSPRVKRMQLAQREADVQRDVKRAYEQAGCFVAVFSQGRKTRQTPGIPDLYVFPPVGDGRDGRFGGAPWFHETKAVGGKQSRAQWEWQSRCAERDVDYVLGGLLAALVQLHSRGFEQAPTVANFVRVRAGLRQKESAT